MRLVLIACTLVGWSASVEAQRVQRTELPPSVARTAPRRAPPSSVRPNPAGRVKSSRPVIMLTGYWPPTNEMLRRFSTSTTQNPSGWIGSNWEGRGYDIHAFFPEFPAGSFPKGVGDFEVDYQDTVADWSRITKQLEPRAISTFSLDGSSNGRWEYERNASNHARWTDDSQAPFQPTPSPPDATLPASAPRRMTFPARRMVSAIAASRLRVNPSVDWRLGGGDYLSEFIAYLGLWYKNTHSDRTAKDWCVASGHVHVGPNQIPELQRVVAVHLRELIGYIDAVAASREQQNMGYGHRGRAVLRMHGTPLTFGGRQDVSIRGMDPNRVFALVLSPRLRPRMYGGGANTGVHTFWPPQVVWYGMSDPGGNFDLRGIPGAATPQTFYAQAAYPDGLLNGFVGVTNTLEVRVGR